MRILVVEDEQDLASAIATSLRRDGYATDVATDGTTALDRVAKMLTHYDTGFGADLLEHAGLEVEVPGLEIAIDETLPGAVTKCESREHSAQRCRSFAKIRQNDPASLQHHDPPGAV